MTQEYLDKVKNTPHGQVVDNLIAEIERMWTWENTLRSHERIETFLDRQWRWSRVTFGDKYRAEQLLDHIRKELAEITADPKDRIEWLDVALLALDGYNRCAGGDTVSLMPDLLEKQRINFQRKWVFSGDGRAVEHDRDDGNTKT